MIENFESKITFEIPTNLDFDKLIRGNNYTLFWQNLQQQQQQHQQVLGGSVAAGAGGAAARLAGSAFGGMDGGPFGGGGGSSSLFGGIDYSNGSSDYGLLNSLQSFANRGRDGLGGGVGIGTEQMLDPTYERFIGDVWVGIVLTLMILSSIFCMCSCFLYHKFRQWQRNVLTARSQTLSSMDIETPPPYDAESLPSYTIVSGLPSYQDAIEQLKQKQMKYYEPVKVHRPSVMKLFESQDLLGPPTTPCTVSTPHPVKLEEIRYNFVRAQSLQQPDQMLPNEPTTSTPASNAGASAGSSQPTPPPPPPPYKSQISTISTTSSVGGGGGGGSSMVVELPAMQNGVPITLIRAPHKKLDVCHYTIEHERPLAATGGRS